MDEKKEIYLKKELIDYKCKRCGRMVVVSLATPKIIETDTHIIHTWYYGHDHKLVFALDEDSTEPFLLEES